VTNSRDTQELLPDAGQEMLRIFHTHPARTSLLQDFAFYEVSLAKISGLCRILKHIGPKLQAMQKMQATGGAASPSPPVLASPQLQSNSALNTNMGYNPNSYGMQPMMQMGMGMGGGQYGGGNQQGGLQTQAMHQSVMRHPSPGPQQHAQGQAQIGAQGGYTGF